MPIHSEVKLLVARNSDSLILQARGSKITVREGFSGLPTKQYKTWVGLSAIQFSVDQSNLKWATKRQTRPYVAKS